ncbi:MAG: hypothetical protein WCE54_17095 [Ignavibacteriaceae bacterium]
MKNIISIVTALILAIMIYGCASSNVLQTVNGYNNQVSSKKIDGINIITKVNYWNGNPQVTQYVTPVFVTITNNSNKELKISYQQFALVSPSGKRFSALPPFGVSGAVSKPVLIQPYNPILSPGFFYRGFLLAPFYSSIYPEIPICSGQFFFDDPLYYDNYYNYWGQIQYSLPTAKMVNEALPEGIIQKGGEISGYLYFEKVDDVKSKKVDFKADLINSETGKNFAVISIPYILISE